MIRGFTTKPFLKWAGGKTQLLEALAALFPSELRNGGIRRYAEPMVGGGAVLFHIAQFYPVQEVLVSDINEEIILTYTSVQRDIHSLIAALDKFQGQYLALDHDARAEYFYSLRSDFNSTHGAIDFSSFDSSWVERAAQIIFLNRTCYNGLFRVNSQGGFNVPHGDYKNPRISDPPNLMAAASILQRATIRHGSFQILDDMIDESTFVYFDPPYRPLSRTSNFTSYSSHDFNDDAQRDLASYFHQLHKRGAKLMLSNSDPKNTDPHDTFFEALYGQYQISKVAATRMINRDATRRGPINELVITNYSQPVPHDALQQIMAI